MRSVRPVLAVLCLLPAVGLAACGDDDDVKLAERTLTLTESEEEGPFAFIDNPPKTRLGREGPERVSNGDQISFAADLVDEESGDSGKSSATCLASDSTGQFETTTWVCHGAFTLPDGTISLYAAGEIFGEEEEEVVGAVTGGTGAYEGATGEFTSQETDEGTQDEVRLLIPEE